MRLIRSRRRLWVILAAAFTLFLINSALGERGIIRLRQMVRQRDDLRSSVRDLREGNADLGRKIQRLRNDPVTIENLARTELGMVREGETVYILKDRPGEQTQ